MLIFLNGHYDAHSVGNLGNTTILSMHTTEANADETVLRSIQFSLRYTNPVKHKDQSLVYFPVCVCVASTVFVTQHR